MTTLVIISIVLVVLYVGITIYHTKSIPESISAMVFDLKKPWQWVWSAWLASVTVMISPALTAAMPDVWYGIAGHIFIVLLAMTAAMPLLPGYHNKAHYICGIAAGIMSQICVALICPWWLLVWCIFPAVVMLKGVYYTSTYFDGKGVFLAEMVCAVTACGSLLARLASVS